MGKLEVLEKQHDIILDTCLEKSSAIYANKCNLENYNQVILVKDYLSRIKRVIFKGLGKSVLLIGTIILVHNLEFIPIFLPNIDIVGKISLTIFGIVFTIESLSELKEYFDDNKKYKNVVRRYDYLSLQELNEKVQELEEKSKILQMELKENRTILNYLKDEIADEKKKLEEKTIKRTLPAIDENKKIDYASIHLKEYEIPKVKVKRRDEKCYKNQKGPMM